MCIYFYVSVNIYILLLLILEELLDRNIACSHLRAWQLFIESIRTQKEECKFTAWPCPQGGISYARGMCFPMESTEWNQEMGYAANRGPLGIYYLATRADSPFCGKPQEFRKILSIQHNYNFFLPNIIIITNTQDNERQNEILYI